MMVSGLVLCCLLTFVAAKPADLNPADPMLNLNNPVLDIVGGSTATLGQFPWQLLLKANGHFVCGAVLIANNRALTAAHCLISSLTFTATAGEHDTGSTDGHEVTRAVSSWSKHPNYSEEDGYFNDIAVLRFSSPFPTNDFVKSITMASGTDYTGESCYISGWGKLSGGGSVSSTLQYALMPVISNSECQTKWSEGNVLGANIFDGHICVYQSGKSACKGDSGGPMVCGNTLVGITSWGIKSCSGGYPTVYSRVSYFRPWIVAN